MGHELVAWPRGPLHRGQNRCIRRRSARLQECAAKNIGHVIASSIADRPWSQYFCCMLATSTEFAQKYPIATKRVLRAILKAADLCVSEPKADRAAAGSPGIRDRYDYALQVLSEIRYDLWRDYDPDDTLRFYALRMHEAGLIKSSPQKLIAEHTDLALPQQTQARAEVSDLC